MMRSGPKGGCRPRAPAPSPHQQTHSGDSIHTYHLLASFARARYGRLSLASAGYAGRAGRCRNGGRRERRCRFPSWTWPGRGELWGHAGGRSRWRCLVNGLSMRRAPMSVIATQSRETVARAAAGDDTATAQATRGALAQEEGVLEDHVSLGPGNKAVATTSEEVLVCFKSRRRGEAGRHRFRRRLLPPPPAFRLQNLTDYHRPRRGIRGATQTDGAS